MSKKKMVVVVRILKRSLKTEKRFVLFWTPKQITKKKKRSSKLPMKISIFYDNSVYQYIGLKISRYTDKSVYLVSLHLYKAFSILGYSQSLIATRHPGPDSAFCNKLTQHSFMFFNSGYCRLILLTYRFNRFSFLNFFENFTFLFNSKLHKFSNDCHFVAQIWLNWIRVNKMYTCFLNLLIFCIILGKK